MMCFARLTGKPRIGGEGHGCGSMCRLAFDMARTLVSLVAATLTLVACGGSGTAPLDNTPIAVDSGAPGVPALGIGGSLNGRLPFPSDNAWNTDISSAPVDPNSPTLIASGGDRGLHPDFGTVWNGAPNGIPYVVVSGSQPKVSVSFDYADESDTGPYPVPPNAPVEGGSSSSGDRHVIVIDRDSW